MSEEAPPFFTRYGFTRTGNPRTPLEIKPYPEICDGGTLRATIIASAIDLVGGLFTREIAGVDALMTSDLSLRIPEPSTPPHLRVRGERIRIGSRLVTTAVRIEANESPFAYGETSFVRVPRAKENAPPLEALQTPAVIERNPLSTPLVEEVGIVCDDDAPGRVLLDLRPALLNPEGMMQGALVALVIECAALSLADRTPRVSNSGMAEAWRVQSARTRPRHAVTSLDLRYLSANSIGPVIGEAQWIGPPLARMIRVELRDKGRENRLTASALISVKALSAD